VGAISGLAPIAALRFVFVAASVTLYAVLELSDSLFAMLASDALDRMLVAPITGVAIESVGVARLAIAGRVVTIEAEVLFVLECRR
jgi:hypothetical protein